MSQNHIKTSLAQRALQREKMFDRPVIDRSSKNNRYPYSAFQIGDEVVTQKFFDMDWVRVDIGRDRDMVVRISNNVNGRLN